MKLSPQEQVRYTRQLMLPEIGTEGQLRLKQSSVLVIGAGGLGSPAILLPCIGWCGSYWHC